jgi:hypothetical protein
MNLKITYIGGPTALLEFAGVQLLTDQPSILPEVSIRTVQ